jgi:hypothetical protein
MPLTQLVFKWKNQEKEKDGNQNEKGVSFYDPRKRKRIENGKLVFPMTNLITV